jgi:hypothetical protein
MLSVVPGCTLVPDALSKKSSELIVCTRVHCAFLAYAKRRTLQQPFINFHFSPRYNNHDPKPLSRKTQGLFLCLEVSILLFRTITIIITIVF